MPTKRKQTLLAGAGLLTALTLTMAGCTPSKFTPGPGVPSQANTPNQSDTPTAAVLSISGNADFLGTPMANADLKITDLVTGNVIATGGGNTKTDAAGNFSVEVPGLTADDVVRIDVTNADGSLSTLMTGDGQTPGGDAPAGYHVAATNTLAQKLVVGLSFPTSMFTDHVNRVTAVVARYRQQRSIIFNSYSLYRQKLQPYISGANNRTRLKSYVSGRINPLSNGNNLNEVTQASGVGSILRETLTEAFRQAVKIDVKVAQNLNNKPLSEALPDTVVTLVGNTVSVNGQSFNLDPQPTTGEQPPVINPVPTAEQLQADSNAVKDEGTDWVFEGNMSPTVTFSANSVTVAQDADESQMISLTMLLPEDKLTGDSLANLSGANLTGTVTGTTRNNASRSGTLTFGALNTSSTGTITLGTFGQIGTYTVTKEGAAWKIKMLYTFNESGIELVGAHSTTITATNVTIDTNDMKGVAIVIAGTNGSARRQF